MRLQIVTPPAGYDAGAVSFGISPDGQNIVFVAAPDQTPRLWIRPLASEIARPIAGTERGSLPFWSPDGRTIGFFADQKLKRVDIAGGTPQTLADAPRPYGATWNSDGMILFSGLNTSPLYRVPAIGGQRPVAATRLDTTRQVSHRFPHFLPDGRRFLFFATGSSDVQGVYIGSLDSEETRRLVSASTAAVFVSPDYLLFGRGEALYAQRLETQSMEPVGDPRLVAERVARDSLTFASVALAASSAGTFAYRTPAESARELVWLDRAGKQIGSLGRPEGLTPSVPRLSPDGGSVIVQRTVDGNTDIWVIDTTRGVLKRLTFDPAADSARAWSPDGLRVLVGSARKKGGGVNDLYVTSLSGTSDKLLLESAENKNGFDWSRDGRFIVYTSDSPTTAGDIWTLPLDGDRRPFAVVRTNSQETSPQISRDGNWIAYHSTETGRYEVFVQAFPAPGRNWQISTAGGGVARWRADGRELFYIALDARLMAVPISVNPHGSTVEAGTPVPLFSVRVGSDYDVTPDGQRFLINTPTGESSTTPITVVLNWSGLNR
jgi:Tol biopolymer transport system component